MPLAHSTALVRCQANVALTDVWHNVAVCVCPAIINEIINSNKVSQCPDCGGERD